MSRFPPSNPRLGDKTHGEPMLDAAAVCSRAVFYVPEDSWITIEYKLRAEESTFDAGEAAQILRGGRVQVAMVDAEHRALCLYNPPRGVKPTGSQAPNGAEFFLSPQMLKSWPKHEIDLRAI